MDSSSGTIEPPDDDPGVIITGILVHLVLPSIN